MRICSIAIPALALALSSPAAAYEPIEEISAKRPAEIALVLMNAGYDVELGEDGIGDPMIISELAGYPLRIYFYDCGEDSSNTCTSLRFSVGFDRKKPWTGSEALEISKQYRFASVRLDNEGDPFVSWDIITEDGIPTKVFLAAVQAFEDNILPIADAIFADELDEDAEQGSESGSGVEGQAPEPGDSDA